MRASKATGLQPGVGDADKQYWANSVTDRLHDPAFSEGFTPSMDYRIDRLGAQGGDHGAVYIEGGAYCPGTPEPVRNATKDLMSGALDNATYWERINTRKAFKLHQQEKPDAKGRTMLLVNFNLRKIAAFMSDQYKEHAKRNLAGNPVEKKLRRRDRDFYNRYTDTLPPGVERPKHLTKRGTATDDTGGPPSTE